MKACKIQFSTDLLLEQLGLENAQALRVYQATVNPEQGYVTLYLTGDYEGLPDIDIGQEVPLATIICSKIISKIEVHSPHKI